MSKKGKKLGGDHDQNTLNRILKERKNTERK